MKEFYSGSVSSSSHVLKSVSLTHRLKKHDMCGQGLWVWTNSLFQDGLESEVICKEAAVELLVGWLGFLLLYLPGKMFQDYPTRTRDWLTGPKNSVESLQSCLGCVSDSLFEFHSNISVQVKWCIFLGPVTGQCSLLQSCLLWLQTV